VGKRSQLFATLIQVSQQGAAHLWRSALFLSVFEARRFLRPIKI
jgi:hypothetical protein